MWIVCIEILLAFHGNITISKFSTKSFKIWVLNNLQTENIPSKITLSNVELKSLARNDQLGKLFHRTYRFFTKLWVGYSQKKTFSTSSPVKMIQI